MTEKLTVFVVNSLTNPVLLADVDDSADEPDKSNDGGVDKREWRSCVIMHGHVLSWVVMGCQLSALVFHSTRLVIVGRMRLVVARFVQMAVMRVLPHNNLAHLVPFYSKVRSCDERPGNLCPEASHVSRHWSVVLCGARAFEGSAQGAASGG